MIDSNPDIICHSTGVEKGFGDTILRVESLLTDRTAVLFCAIVAEK